MRSATSLILLTVLITLVSAQDTLHRNDQDIIENILDNSSDEQDVQLQGEELEYFKSHPINLTQPRYGDFMKLPFVSPMLAESIILLCDTVSITTVEQIRSASLMTDAMYDKLRPFVTVKDKWTSASAFEYLPSQFESRFRAEQRLQKTKGVTQNKYLSNELNSYERLRISSSNLEIGAVFEKDAGELYADGLIGGYVSMKDAAFIRQIVVGNFSISSGEGLLFAKNIASSKGSNAVGQVRKRSSIISPNISTDEFRYFQGAASQLQFGEMSVVGFYSQRKLPATLDSNGSVISFYTSGLYRTVGDLERRNTLDEKTVGGKIEYSLNQSGTFSLMLMNVRYDHSIDRGLFDFADKRSLSAGSFAWEIPIHGVIAFGEAATNDVDTFSKIFGFIIPVSKSFAVSYHHRAFSNGYVNPFARPFGERSNIAEGELGNYLGVEIKKEKVTVNAYLEYFTLPPSTLEFETVGRETFANVSFPISRMMDIVFQMRNKERSQTGIRNADDARLQSNYRASFTIKVSRCFSITNRIEAVKVSYRPSKYFERGLLTFMEGSYRDNNSGVRLRSRMIFYDTKSYDSRLYQYESDVAGNFSNPPMYGKGVRWYIVAGVELFREFVLSFKYSETKKLNEVILGSGDDEIIGNFDNRIALQLDFQF